MKFVVGFLLLFVCSNVFAGSLFVEVDGAAGSFGSELKYYSLETRGNVSYLYLQSKSDDACRVPIQLLKDLGIDPLQTAHLLLNSGSTTPVFFCHISKTELGRTKIAHSISFTSFPKQ